MCMSESWQSHDDGIGIRFNEAQWHPTPTPRAVRHAHISAFRCNIPADWERGSLGPRSTVVAPGTKPSVPHERNMHGFAVPSSNYQPGIDAVKGHTFVLADLSCRGGCFFVVLPETRHCKGEALFLLLCAGPARLALVDGWGRQCTAVCTSYGCDPALRVCTE